jgi:predicted dehydrogenase
MSDTLVRWGVIGPGRIANRFAESLSAVPGARLVAAASRDASRARDFASRHGAERHYGDYASLFGDAEIDAIYVATPHTQHADLSILALQAGKAVLCEKPLTVNVPQAQRVFAAATEHQRFVMEAFWTRFLPVYAQVRRWLDEERIGRVTDIETYFGYAQPRNPDDRLFRADLAGGALLDVGVYCISMSQHLFPGPLRLLEASATVGETGVDEDLKARVAVGTQGIELRMHASMTSRLYNCFTIKGEQGDILITEPFWDTGQAILLRHGEAPVASFSPYLMNGFEYQVQEVQRCMARGALESTVMPWADSLAVLGCMDEIRARVGVRYPFE